MPRGGQDDDRLERGDGERGQNGGETFEVVVSETAPVEAEALTADEEMGPAEEI